MTEAVSRSITILEFAPMYIRKEGRPPRARGGRGKSKIGYIVPEVAGTRFTHQNDRESLLYTLVGPKMRLIEVNTSVWTDM